jgi:putative transposase
LLVLRRTARRPRWPTADRLILAALGRKLSAGALLLVQPATILGWHRALVRHRWAAFGRRLGPGRPELPAEGRELVLRLARQNQLWGYERIRRELFTFQTLYVFFLISHDRRRLLHFDVTAHPTAA